MSQRQRLNQIAEKHGMQPITEAMSPGVYLGYAVDLMMVELGLQKPDEVATVYDVFGKAL